VTLHRVQRALALGALALLAAACAQPVALTSEGSAPAVEPSEEAQVTTSTPASRGAAAEPLRARQWATQVCGATQGFLDAFVYGEPYGMPEEEVPLAELQERDAVLTARVVSASRLVVQLLPAVQPIEAGAGRYQRALQNAFAELADIYAQRGAAVREAQSREAVGLIDAQTFEDVARVIAAVTDAGELLPAATRRALAGVPRCPLLFGGTAPA